MPDRTSFPGLSSFAGDSMRALWERISNVINRRLGYHAVYHVRLEAQSDDKTTADVRPFALRPGLKSPLPEDGVSKVPMAVGLPGVRVTASAGAGVLLAFHAGNPGGAVILPAWDGGESGVEWEISVVRIVANPSDKITLSETGAKQAARKGDTLSASTVLKTWAAAVEAGIVAGGGAAPVPNFAAAAGLTGALGDIATGSAKVEIGD